MSRKCPSCGCTLLIEYPLPFAVVVACEGSCDATREIYGDGCTVSQAHRAFVSRCASRGATKWIDQKARRALCADFPVVGDGIDLPFMR